MQVKARWALPKYYRIVCRCAAQRILTTLSFRGDREMSTFPTYETYEGEGGSQKRLSSPITFWGLLSVGCVRFHRAGGQKVMRRGLISGKH